MLASQSISADDKAAIEEALAQHKGNPDRQTVVQADGTVVANADGTPEGEQTAKVGRVWEEKIGGVNKEAIKALLEKGEIDFDKALELSSNGEGLSFFCSAKSGWICFTGRSRFGTNVHPERLRQICQNAPAILAIMDKYAAETTKALKAAK